MKADLVVIGGGPAGMAAALGAYEAGIRNIVILEREQQLGGILQQCIHNGFGLHKFGEELTGPEYAARYSRQVEEKKIPYFLGTTALDITKDRIITAINEKKGIFTIHAGAVVLAMGCRERSRGALNIPGSRPAGIYTAGAAQKFVNIKGYLPGKNVVILGSGDIGLIMARRMTLEGANVKAVCELMPFSSGLTRNIVQCLEDYNIPLKLSHTITKIHGKDRICGVTVSQVDAAKCPIPGKNEYISCDTLLLSVGLIPENELSQKAGVEMDPVTSGAIVDEQMETSVDGIFACGNVLHVHDLVDYVSQESELAGFHAAEYIQRKNSRKRNYFCIRAGEGTGHIVPQRLRCDSGGEVKVYFRVAQVFRNADVIVRSGDCIVKKIFKKKIVPGEMQYLSLSGLDGDCTISVEERKV